MEGGRKEGMQEGKKSPAVTVRVDGGARLKAAAPVDLVSREEGKVHSAVARSLTAAKG